MTARACGGLALAALLFSSLAIAPAGASTGEPGSGESLVSPEDHVLDLPAWIDAMDGIMRKGSAWNADPAIWPHTAAIEHRNSSVGINEARVKIRMEGKGDPVNQRVPQQTMLVIDNSASMATQDASGTRCDGIRHYLDQLSPPDEAGVADFNDTGRLLSVLTTNYAGAKGTVLCQAEGGSGAIYGLKTALDELIPKKKVGFAWAVIFQMDSWNTGGSPQAQVDRAVQEGVKLYTICPGPSTGCDVSSLQSWAAQTGGRYYNPQAATDYQLVYQDIASSLRNDLAGKPPKTGAPMIRFKLAADIEVVPNSFMCDSSTCTSPLPSSPSTIAAGNQALQLEWNAPVAELRIKQYWQVEFGIRSYRTGVQVKVNDIPLSFVEYDRYDGSPGGSDVFEQLYVDVTNSCQTQCLSSVTITPTSAVLTNGATQQFSGQAYDQNGSLMSNVSYSWSTAGSIGTVTQSGLFTATAGGTGGVTVTALQNVSSKSASATVTVDAVAPTIQSTWPAAGTAEVPLASSVQVSWSESMNESSADAAFSPSPSVGCAFSWTSQRFQTCTPSSPLVKNTTYCVTLGTTARDLAGNPLAAPYQFCFISGKDPRLDSTQPADNSTGVPTGSSISLRFNVPMDRPSTEGALAINPTFQHTVSWNGPLTELTIFPNQLLAPNTSYGLSVGTGARSAAGLSLAASASFAFRTVFFLPPYIDALDGIAKDGDPWPPDPQNWTHSAAISQRGSPTGATEAVVKIRIEGKGDPIVQRGPQQTMMVLDLSGSMISTDPSNLRCSGKQYYIDQLSVPDEVGLVTFESTAVLQRTLTTNYADVKSAVVCQALGSSNAFDALRLALDELIAKKKLNHSWAIIASMDTWNSGGDPQPQIDRAVQENVKVFTVCPDMEASCDVASMQRWAQQTGGKYYNVKIASDFQQIYRDLANTTAGDVAGKPPKTGAPMINLKMTNDIEVVPNSFACESTSCMNPAPNNPSVIVAGNKGIKMEWNAPVNQLRINQFWQVSFKVRAYNAGKQIQVNDIAQSFVEYDRYDGSPGGSDVFDQLYLDVEPTICPSICLSRVELAPTGASLLIGDTVSFTPTAYDQNNQPMAGVAYTWGVNGSIGTVSGTGSFTALALGAGEVWVKASHAGVVRVASAPIVVLEKPDMDPPSVVATVPGDSSYDVPISLSIEIAWSEPMDRSSAQSAFQSAPVISCSWSWPTPSRQVCSHVGLAPGSGYGIVVGSTAKDLAGNRPASDHWFSFKTASKPGENAPPTIRHAVPQAAKDGVALELKAMVEDDKGVAVVRLSYRSAGASTFETVRMNDMGGGSYSFTIPADQVKPERMDYFFEAADDDGFVATSPPGAPAILHSVNVRTAPGLAVDRFDAYLWPYLLIAPIAAAGLVAFVLLARRRKGPRKGKLPPPAAEFFPTGPMTWADPSAAARSSRPSPPQMPPPAPHESAHQRAYLQAGQASVDAGHAPGLPTPHRPGAPSREARQAAREAAMARRRHPPPGPG